MRNARLARVTVICGWLAACVGAAWSAPPRTTAQWLLDLARDHALRVRDTPTDADLLLVEALLHAALRVDPDSFETQHALFELAALRNDRVASEAALRRLFELDPTHVGIARGYVRLELADAHTSEQRERVLLGVIGDARYSAYTKAQTCTDLARLAAARLDQTRVDEWLDRAGEIEPDCPDAALAAYELLPANASAERRVATALRLLRICPLHVDAAWEVGLHCDAAGLTEDAARFLEHAQDVRRAADPRATLPAAQLIDWARHLVTRGEYFDAASALEQALTRDPDRLDAAFQLFWLYDQQRRQSAARGLAEALSDRFARVRDPDAWPVDEVAQAAWFHVVIDLEPHRALHLARAAFDRAPQDSFTRRVLGMALLLNREPEQARTVLAPLAADDPYAAAAMIELLRASGEDAAAARLVAEWRHRPVYGPARTLLRRSLSPSSSPTTAPTATPTTAPTTAPTLTATPSPTTAPTSAPAPEEPVTLTTDDANWLRPLLDAFDPTVLEMAHETGRFLRAELRTDQPSVRTDEPCWLTLSLTNRADFPIALGPEWTVNPAFLLSISIDGDRERRYPYLTTVLLDHDVLLKPGASVRLRRPFDIGPPRRVARLTPQQLQRFTIEAILDPVQDGQGHWRPGACGQELDPVYYNRQPQPTGADAMVHLFGRLASETPSDQFAAVQTLAQLLGERQRAAGGGLTYRPAPIPAERIHAALVGALESPSWELRARALDALRIAGLDVKLLRLARANLRHEHWAVRLMALRLLARQGASFADEAARVAQHDADELVRLLARSVVVRWNGSLGESNDIPDP